MALNFQGELTDLVITSQDGGAVSCHKVIVGQLSPLLSILVASPETNTIILADFGKSELHGFMNLIYTGRYAETYSYNIHHFSCLDHHLKHPDFLRKLSHCLLLLRFISRTFQ